MSCILSGHPRLKRIKGKEWKSTESEITINIERVNIDNGWRGVSLKHAKTCLRANPKALNLMPVQENPVGRVFSTLVVLNSRSHS